MKMYQCALTLQLQARGPTPTPHASSTSRLRIGSGLRSGAFRFADGRLRGG